MMHYYLSQFGGLLKHCLVNVTRPLGPWTKTKIFCYSFTRAVWAWKGIKTQSSSHDTTGSYFIAYLSVWLSWSSTTAFLTSRSSWTSSLRTIWNGPEILWGKRFLSSRHCIQSTRKSLGETIAFAVIETDSLQISGISSGEIVFEGR